MQTIKFIKKYLINYCSISASFITTYNKGIFEIVNNVNDGDIIGLTYYNITSLDQLKKLKKEYPKNKIIVGGIGVYSHYHRLLLNGYCDMCYIGEALPFDEKNIITKNDIGTEKKFNQDVDYNLTPLIQAGKKSFYLLTEKGCPYRCEYCYVSWINKFSKIDNDIFKRKIQNIDSKLKNCHISFIGNEGLIKTENKHIFNNFINNDYDNQSIPLKTYLENFEYYKNQDICRFGIELPTEELRFKILPNIKKISDSELIDFIKNKYPIKGAGIATFFYIWNYINVLEKDYFNIFDIIKQKSSNFTLRLSFTTLEIQPYTKISNCAPRHVEQLLNTVDFSESKFLDKCKNITKVKIYPAKNSASVLWHYFFTYLPYNVKISKNRTGETGMQYFNRIKHDNNNIDILQLIDEKSNKMKKIDNNTIILI